MPELYAKADTLLAVKKSQTNSAEIHFQDSKGHMYVVDFPEALLGTLTATLAAVASQLRPSGHGQILTLTSGQIFHVDDGNVGLELTLNGTLRLPLIFQKSGIDDLRTALDELEARKGPDTKETAH